MRVCIPFIITKRITHGSFYVKFFFYFCILWISPAFTIFSIVLFPVLCYTVLCYTALYTNVSQKFHTFELPVLSAVDPRNLLLRHPQLKGNQVKVLNSRATVSVQFCLISIADIREKGGRTLLRESGDLLKTSSFFQHVIGNGVVIYFYVF